MKQTLKREHPCAEITCSRVLRKSLMIETEDPKDLATANLYLRTWLAIADCRCDVCRNADYSKELMEYDRLSAFGDMETALLWAAGAIPRLKMRVITDRGEQLEVLVKGLASRLGKLEHYVGKLLLKEAQNGQLSDHQEAPRPQVQDAPGLHVEE